MYSYRGTGVLFHLGIYWYADDHRNGDAVVRGAAQPVDLERLGVAANQSRFRQLSSSRSRQTMTRPADLRYLGSFAFKEAGLSLYPATLPKQRFPSHPICHEPNSVNRCITQAFSPEWLSYRMLWHRFRALPGWIHLPPCRHVL